MLLATLIVGCASFAPQSAPQYTGKLDTFYMTGTFLRYGKDKVENGNQRLVALRSVRTALAFGTSRETIVAGPGKMLVLITASIRNPEKKPIDVDSAATFGLRLLETKLKQGDVVYRGCADRNLVVPDAKLAAGATMDVTNVYEFPNSYAALKVGIYFDRSGPGSGPNFDLTGNVQRSSSVFATGPLAFSDKAAVVKGISFDLDDLTFKVLECKPIEGNGYAVRIQVANPMPRSGRWGWQYAKAKVADVTGVESDMYPEFAVDKEYADWGFEIKSGKSVTGEYRFFPAKGGAPSKLVLTSNATNRAVSVTGL